MFNFGCLENWFVAGWEKNHPKTPPAIFDDPLPLTCVPGNVTLNISWNFWGTYSKAKFGWFFGKLFYFMKTVYNKMMKHYYIYCKIQLTDIAIGYNGWMVGFGKNQTFEPLIYAFITCKVYFSSQEFTLEKNNIILETCVVLFKNLQIS